MDEEVLLALRGFDAAACDIEIGFVDFDANELAAETGARNAGGAGAHEGVEANAISPFDYRAHKLHRLLSRMIFVSGPGRLNNIGGPILWKMVPRPRIEQNNFGLSGVLVLEIAHRPVVFNPGDKRTRRRNTRKVVPSAEHVRSVRWFQLTGPLQQGVVLVVFDPCVPDVAMVGSEFHAKWRVRHKRLELQAGHDFPSVPEIQHHIPNAFHPPAHPSHSPAPQNRPTARTTTTHATTMAHQETGASDTSATEAGTARVRTRMAGFMRLRQLGTPRGAGPCRTYRSAALCRR